MNESKIVYLFSSAPLKRPAYRRGVLDALAYPSGHRISMSYRRTQVQPELLRDRALQEREAAIIFVDERPHGSDHAFVPIRLCRIVSCATSPNASRVELRVEFGDFVQVNELVCSSIKNLINRPVPYRPGVQYYFALEEYPVLPETSNTPSDIWETLATKLLCAESLKETVMLAVSNIRTYGGGADCNLRLFGDRDKTYSLRPNSIYEMDVRVIGADQPAFVIKSSSDLIVPAQAFPTTIGGVGSYRVILSCKRTLETTTAVLSLNVAKAESNETAEPLKAESVFTHSAPVVLIRIKPSATVLIGFAVLASLGFFLSSLSKDIFTANEAFAFGLKADNAALFSKVLGSLLIAGAAWLGFRRLPGGSA